MNDSQCLDDWPVGHQWPGSEVHKRALVAWGELYSESQRLALEELVAGGEGAYSDFLQRERLKPFLSSEEISHILKSTLSPSSREPALDQSLDQSLDCSTGTYFPEASDIEVPVLDLGWPTYPNNWYRGVTRVDVHFQPGYGEVIYSCKEAVRTLIRKAEKVIALVMDSFTDIEILKDIHEACSRRLIPVYIILDHSGLPGFLQMCRNACVWLETERNLRVRTITGSTYCTRTGARIVGKANEKFLLIDGDKVATGSYSFTWTEGKLNRSNLTVLSGQVSEFYDEEFRVLYAQSKPVTPKPSSPSKGRVKEPSAVANASERGEVTCCNHELQTEGLPMCERRSHGSEASTLGGREGEGEATSPGCEETEEEKKTQRSVDTQTDWEALPETGREAATQTCVEVSQHGTETPSPLPPQPAADPGKSTAAAATQTEPASAAARPAPASASAAEKRGTEGAPASGNSAGKAPHSHSSSDPSSSGSEGPGGRAGEHRWTGFLGAKPNLRHGFQILTKERKHHYSNLRSKLDDMVSILARRPDANGYLGRQPARYPLRNSKDLVNRNGVLRLRDMPLLASMALRN